MLDLERFSSIKEGESVLWNIWAKVGDTEPGDRGWKDGDLTYAQPLEQGIDAYGSPYGGEIRGQDLKGYVVLQARADKETIRNLFKEPEEGTEAHKRKRKNNSFLDIADCFTFGEEGHYRDHTREVPVLKNFNISRISDYRERPERLNKSFRHGSITSGTYYVDGGPAPGYTTLKTAVDDIGAVGSNTLEIIVSIANSPGANIDFDKVTNADGLIHIHSTLYDYRSNPLITGGGKWWLFHGRCNYLIEHNNINGMSLRYTDPTTGSTGRTHTIRCNVLDRTTVHSPYDTNIDNPGTPLRMEFYGNVGLGRSTAGGGSYNIFTLGSGWTPSDVADNVFIFNNTFILEYNYVDGGLAIAGEEVVREFSNCVVYQTVGTYAWDNQLSTETVTLNNCARNKALDGDIDENDCITNLSSGDFVATAISDTDAGKITELSRLYDSGLPSAILPGYTKDIIGNDINASAPQMGAFSAYTLPVARDPILSVDLKSTTAKHTTLEIELSEHVKGLSSYSGSAYWLSNYFRDDFNCLNGDKISVFKKITSLEVEEIALTKKASAAEVVSNAGSWWQDTANEILYVHFTEGDSPSNHTVVAHFNFYLSEDSLTLTADGDTRYFEPYLDPKSMPKIDQKFNEALLGTVNVSGGSFSLLNGNGLFYQLIDKYIWAKRKVTIKRGYDDQAYADYDTINVVTISGWSMPSGKVAFTVKNKYNSLFEDIPGQTFSRDDDSTFGGLTYGDIYPDKVIGQPKPLAWGEFGEAQAPVLHMIYEDLVFSGFTANYSTVSKTDVNMSATSPAYNTNISFAATNIVADDNGNTRSFKPTQNLTYFDREEGFYKGYYIRVDSLGQQARITGFSYNKADDTAEITLDTSDSDSIISSTDWTNFKIYAPVYHYFVANHAIKSFDTIYVDNGGEEGIREWIYLDHANDSKLVDSEWTRLIVPIPGYSSSNKVRLAFKSKDVDGGGDSAKKTLENHADIVEDILTSADVLSTPFVAGDLDAASFAKSATDRKYPLVIYLDKAIKAIDVLGKIRQSVIAKLMLTSDDKFKYVAWSPENPVAAGIPELTINEMLNDAVYSVSADNIYYGFIVKHSQDGDDGSFQEERYVYEPTKYLYRTTQTKTIETYLKHASHAQRTAQRYTYFNRNINTKVSFSIPHNVKRDDTFETALVTPGEYVKVTTKRGPGPESAFGGEFGVYQKTYEVLAVKDNSKNLAISGDNIKGLSINAGRWSNTDGDDPTGNWTNAAGESVPGDDTTINISLWV